MSCSPESRAILEVATEAALDALAEDPVAIDVTENLPFADAFLIVTADNPRHLKAVQSEVSDRLRIDLGVHTRVEGGEDSDWVLVDGGDVLIHVMLPEAREFYALEKLWGHSPRLRVAKQTA